MWDMLGKNVCVNMMHNEDNTLGVQVRSGDQKTAWRSYGDSTLFDDSTSARTKEQSYKALKASVDEVYEAHTTKTTKAAKDFKAWESAPTMTPFLETPASHDPENFPPMFRIDEKTKTVWQRKGLLPYKTGAVSKSTPWEYEPVVGKPKIPGLSLIESKLGTEKYHKYMDYLYWSTLAYRLTPYTTMGITLKNEVTAWMADLPWYAQPLNWIWTYTVA